IHEANALADRLAAIGLAGEMRPMSEPDQAITALLRSDARDIRAARNPVAVFINPELGNAVDLSLTLNPLPPAAGAALIPAAVLHGEHDAAAPLNGGEVRVVKARPTTPIARSPKKVSPAQL